MSLQCRATQLNECLLFFRVLPFKVHQLLVSMVSFSVPVLSFHQSGCVRKRTREQGRERRQTRKERGNDRKLFAVVISPLHKVPFALPPPSFMNYVWINSPAGSYGSLRGLQVSGRVWAHLICGLLQKRHRLIMDENTRSSVKWHRGIFLLVPTSQKSTIRLSIIMRQFAIPVSPSFLTDTVISFGLAQWERKTFWLMIAN